MLHLKLLIVQYTFDYIVLNPKNKTPACKRFALGNSPYNLKLQNFPYL